MQKTGCGATANRWPGTRGDGHNSYFRPLTWYRNAKLPVGSRPAAASMPQRRNSTKNRTRPMISTLCIIVGSTMPGPQSDVRICWEDWRWLSVTR